MAENSASSDITTRVTELIASSDSMSWGHECAQVLSDAITQAEAAGLDQYAYAARLRLANNCSQIDDDETLLATFAVALAQHSADPARFPSDPGEMSLPGLRYNFADLMWIYKWIPRVLAGNPEFTLDDVEGAIADMTADYQREGIPGKAITQVHLSWAINRGADDEIAHWLDVVAATPSDDYGNCEACSRSLLIDAALHLGDTERALVLLDELLQGDFDCVEEPQGAYSTCLGVLADSGRQTELNIAIDAILGDAFRLCEDPVTLSNMALFLVTADDAPRALALVKRVMHCIADNPLDQSTHERQLAVLAVVADANPALADRPMPEADKPAMARYFGQNDPHTLRSAGERARIAALELAAAFDARNGTNHHTRRITAVLATVPGSRSSIAVTLPPDAGLAFAEASHTELFQSDDAPRVQVEDTAGAVIAALNYAEMGRPDDALAVVRDWLVRTEAPMSAAALLFAGAVSSEARGEPETAIEFLHSCAAALVDAGQGDLGLLLTELGSHALERGTASLRTQDVTALFAKWAGRGCPTDVIAVGFALLSAARDRNAADQGWAALGDTIATPAQAPNSSSLFEDPCWGGFVLRAAANRLLDARGVTTDPAAATLAGRQHPCAVVAASSQRVLSELALQQGDDEQAYGAAMEFLLLSQAWAGADARAAAAAHLMSVCGGQNRGSEVLALNGYLGNMTGLLAPHVALAIHGLRSESLAGMGALRGADAALEDAFDILGLAEVDDGAVEGRLLLQRARLHDRSRRNKAAITDYLAAASACDGAGQDDMAMMAALGGARVSLRQGDSARAGQLAELVIAAIGQLGGNHAQLLEARLILADAAERSLGDVDTTRTLYTAVLEACDDVEPVVGNAYRLHVFEALAKALWAGDLLDEAVETATSGLELAKGAEVFGEGAPSSELPFRILLGRLALTRSDVAAAAAQAAALLEDRFGETGQLEGKRLQRRAAAAAAPSGAAEPGDGSSTGQG